MTKSEKSPTIANTKELTLLTICLFSHSLHPLSLKIDDIDEYKEFLAFFGGTSVRNTSLVESFWPTANAPDICASCFTLFGYTVGGRVRIGCPLCRKCSTETRNAVIFFQIFSDLSSAEAIFWLSVILTTHYQITDFSGA